MVIVRAVCLDDLDELWRLIEQATYGLTTLQISKEQLSERVELSHFAFTRKTEKPSGEPYVFVMEDTTVGKIVGLSCIFSKTGGYEPFYSYRRKTEEHYCEILDKTQVVESLHLEKIHDGPTEIGSLFLLPDFRGQGRGRLLSMCRFAFMAAHPKRFAKEVIAEMRGVMSESGECPFWEAIGRYFFEMDFPQADSLSTINKEFIEDLMPRYPIYTNLLSEEARSILGEVHQNTRPALAMLEAEGFEKVNLIDIFDGGPVVSCQLGKIDAIRRTMRCTVASIGEVASDAKTLVASAHGGFTAMVGSVDYEEVNNAEERRVAIDQLTAATLRLRVGDPLWITSLRPTS